MISKEDMRIQRSELMVVLALMMCWAMGVMRLASAQTAAFLPPDQAFVFKAQMINPTTAQVQFNIAPNYYMYRDEFTFAVVSPDGAVVQNGTVKLPTAQIKFDENFNKDMAIYHGSVVLNVPVKKIKTSDGLFKLVVTSRGCADKGLCYPPRKTQAVLNAVGDVAVTVATADGTNVDAGNAPKKVIEAVAPETATNPSVPASVNDAAVVTTPVIAPVEPSGQNDSVRVTETADATTADNTAYARNVFVQNNPLVALAVVFGLGVLLSLTPCMLPMLPILSTMLAGQSDRTRGRGIWLALSYVTGMALIYALVGVLAAQTGASLHRYLQSPWVLGVFAALLGLMALSMFDVFQLQLPASWQNFIARHTQGRSGYVGAAVLGAASAVIASPCVTAPLVGLIAYISQSGHVGMGGLALFVLAYGMGVPLLILGAGFGRLVPRSGAWMVRVKQFIGVLMLAAAVWIAQPLWGKYWDVAWGTPSAVQFQSVRSVDALNQVVAESDKPVLVDMYADWCRSCIEMEKKTFPDARVQKIMSGMTLVRVDMTNYTDDDAALLARFKLYGPPAILLLEPLTGTEKVRVVGYQTPDEFVKSLSAP